MRRQYAGGAKPTTLSSALGGSTADLTISGTDFSNYPDGSVGPFYIVIDRGLVAEEKILCSSRSSNTISVYSSGLTNGRGSDGTSVVAHSPGATVEHVFTAVDADEANSHVNASSSVHGVSGSVVGTSSTQTLTNKTMSGASNTFSNIPAAAVVGLSTDYATLTTTQNVSNKNVILTANAQSGSYTLVLSDSYGRVVEMSNGGTLTIPLNSSVAFPVGTQITVVQTGASQVTIAGASGVTVNSAGGYLKTAVQWGAVTLIKRGTDTWLAIGALVA